MWRQASWLVSLVCVGLVAALVSSSVRQPVPLHGMTAHGSERKTLVTVPLDGGMEAVVALDHVTAELTGESGRLLWIPPGMAHGFCVLGDEPADVLYKVDQPYNRATEGGILWCDTELGIDWPVKQPIVSERDRRLQTFSEFRAQMQVR